MNPIHQIPFPKVSGIMGHCNIGCIMSAFWLSPPLFVFSNSSAELLPNALRDCSGQCAAACPAVSMAFWSWAFDDHICSERQAALGVDEGLRYTPHP